MNSNSIARLIDELPGLVGALQPAGGAPQDLSELARRQHRQNVANAMLAAASGLLTPSPNRYPLGPLQRLGAGLGAALQSYGEGAGQERIMDALAADNAGARSRGEAGAQAALGGAPLRAPHGRGALKATAGEAAAASGAMPAPRRIAGRSGGAAGKAEGARLRKFSGTLARRLEHPAVLPGGWHLYGYEKGSDRPVYVGPDRELRIYG